MTLGQRCVELDKGTVWGNKFKPNFLCNLVMANEKKNVQKKSHALVPERPIGANLGLKFCPVFVF